MSKTVLGQSNRDRMRTETRKHELIDLIASFLPEDGSIEPIKGLYLFRTSSSGEPIHSVYKPSLCVVAQGSKEFFLNKERYVYDPDNYLLVTAELPLVGQVLEAANERPYLSLLLALDPAIVGSVIAEIGDIPPKNNAHVRAINVGTLNIDLLDAVLRLIRVLEKPSEAPFLAPMITKELIYRLWISGQRERLLHIVNSDGNTPLISKAIETIHEKYDQQLRVETIANDLGMSISGFHHHFKAVTAMSPLQYQKRLRLQEARRLLISENFDASSAGFQVGYNDASQFSREYKRFYGLPPIRDIERLREAASRQSVSHGH